MMNLGCYRLELLQPYDKIDCLNLKKNKIIKQ